MRKDRYRFFETVGQITYKLEEQKETTDIINKLYSIVVELDARECSNNMVSIGLRDKSWTELCEEAIQLLEKIK